MDPITNTDRLMALLRQRLRERAGTTSAKKTDGRRSAPAAVGLGAIALLRDADESQLRRTCVQALLADQLGGSLLNDAQFQQVVTRVTDVICADPSSERLLDRVVNQLRAG